MRRGLARVLMMSAIGASAGAVAALVGYAFRGSEPLSMDLSIKVDDLTLSDELWCIVGLSLLGFLVCGLVAAVYVFKRGIGRTLLAFFTAGVLGGFLCWGARWVMDAITYATLGGPEKSIDLLAASVGTMVPWLVWQVGCGFALGMPIAVGLGLNKYTVLRGLIASMLVMVVGYVLAHVLGIVFALLMVGTVVAGGDPTDSAQAADVTYLFILGASAGIAFGIAEVVYKPAWLKARRGAIEGRTWPLQGHVSRIGSQEGLEVFLVPDGTVAPLHAQIQAEDEGHFIVAVGGPVAVNAAPVQSSWLQDGDVVNIGSSELVYRSRLESPAKKTEPRRIQQEARQPVLIDPMGGRHLLKQGTNTIGREIGNDIVLSWEPSLSRRHAEITVDQSGVYVRDLNSTNGTFIAGQRVTESKLTGEVTLGNCTLRLEQ